jgi:hypothetical protein
VGTLPLNTKCKTLPWSGLWSRDLNSTIKKRNTFH